VGSFGSGNGLAEVFAGGLPDVLEDGLTPFDHRDAIAILAGLDSSGSPSLTRSPYRHLAETPGSSASVEGLVTMAVSLDGAANVPKSEHSADPAAGDTFELSETSAYLECLSHLPAELYAASADVVVSHWLIAALAGGVGLDYLRRKLPLSSVFSSRVAPTRRAHG
jgi:hypothetical protein